MKSKLNVKNKVLLFISILIAVFFFSFIYNIIETKTTKISFDKYNSKIIYKSNLNCKNKKCTIVGKYQYIVVENNRDYALNIDLKYDNMKSFAGKIYYANSLDEFNEKDSRSFKYKNGKNYINVDKDYKYIRLDLVGKDNGAVLIKNIQMESKLLYSIKNIDLINIVINTIFIFSIILLFKNKKIDSAFVFILIYSIYIIFKTFIFKQNVYIYLDTGTDTFYQYYPYLYNIVSSIKNHQFTIWNFNYGLGTSMINNVSWIFDIFSLSAVVLSLISKPSNLVFLLIWMQIIKIITIYFLSRKYFKYFFNEKIVINLCALMCAMSGYIFLWGQHYFLGTSIFFLMLILVSIEEILKSNSLKSNILFILSISCLLIYSFYIGYMILIFIFFYILYRLISQEKFNLKKSLNKCMKFVLKIIIAFMISGIIFIPATYHVLTNSSRLSAVGDNIFLNIFQSLIGSFDFHYLLSGSSRMLSNNLLFINNGPDIFEKNYYEMSILFISVFTIFFITQFIIYKLSENKNKKGRTLLLINIIAAYFLIFNKLSGLVFNAFAYPSFRYTYILIPMLVYCMGYVIENMILNKKINNIGTYISLIITLLIWFASFYLQPKEIHFNSYIILIFIILGYLLLILLNDIKKGYTVILCSFIAIVIISNVYDNYITTNYRNLLNSGKATSIFNNGTINTNTIDAIKYLRSKDKSYYRIEKNYEDFNNLADSFLELYSSNTVYNSALNKDLQNYYINIYKKANISSAIKVSCIDDINDLKILSLTNSKYILSYEPLDIENLILIKQINDLKIYENKLTTSIAKWYNKSITTRKFESLNEANQMDLLLDNAIVSEKNLENNNSEAKIDNFNISKGRLKGKITTNDDGILMLSIPNEEGWNIYVNGKKVKTFSVDYGFIGLKLSKGEYNIVAKYNFPRLNIGIITSVLGILILILYILSNIKIKNVTMNNKNL